MSKRLCWPEILGQAAGIVYSYSTAVTLRQLHYRLVAAGIIPNTSTAYKTLSSRTAEARRAGEFPALADKTRGIERLQTFADIAEAKRWLARIYRRDRTENQGYNVYIGTEKATLTNQLSEWFGDPLGLPIVALRGYASQTLADDVNVDAYDDGRPAVLLYTGDFDPTGEDVLRDFEKRTNGAFDEIVRVALNSDQVDKYGLPPQPGKATDTRAARFIARHGELVQVELEALDPEDLRRLYQEALDEFWDKSAYEHSVVLEHADLEVLG